MLKQTFTALAAALFLGLTLSNAPVFADEVDEYGVMPISETDESNGPVDSNTDTIEEPDVIINDEINCTDEQWKDKAECSEKIDLETGGEDIEIEEDEELEEAPMWPVYLSLGALGLAILVFIILNIAGRKHKK